MLCSRLLHNPRRVLICSTLDVTASIRREGAKVHREFTKHGPTQTTYGLGVSGYDIEPVNNNRERG